MPKIEISHEVWEHLQRLATPFVDHTPDDVLRRILPGVPKAKGLHAAVKLAISTDPQKPALSPREEGKRVRRDYVSRLQTQGMDIRLADSVWAHLERTDSWVAIPFAAEHGGPGRWFLGLPETDVAQRNRVFVVLLCQEESGSVVDIVLPPDVVTVILPRLSCSKGQVKFNVKRVGNRYQLMIPRAEPMDLSSYVKGRSLLSK